MRIRRSERRESSPCERYSNIRAIQFMFLSLALGCGHDRARQPSIENTGRKGDILQIVIDHPLASGDALLSLSLQARMPGAHVQTAVQLARGRQA